MRRVAVIQLDACFTTALSIVSRLRVQAECIPLLRALNGSLINKALCTGNSLLRSLGGNQIRHTVGQVSRNDYD